MEWPDWWAWDLEFTPHLEKRMEDRDFTEIDLTRHRGRSWEVIVEPDSEDRLLIVVTAYPVERQR